MEIIVRVEASFRARIGEVKGFFWIHCDKDLDQRKESREDAFAGVFFNLVAGLAHRHTALFQLNMDDWHAVDEQHQVATAIV